ncbi:MAG: TMEM43 family protein [Anaerolineae bacterium]
MRNQNRGCGFIAIPIGIIIFFAAFFVIWFNEGRVDLSVLAEDSVPLTADQFSPENEGQLVSVSGTIEANEMLGDDPYLKPQPLIHLVRTAEMYAWDESGDDEDGYSYRKEWTSSPENSDDFDQPSGHQNPPMSVTGDNFSLQSATLGQYTILPTQIVFNQVDDVSLSEGIVSGGRMSENFVYVGSASPQDPQIGDIRLSYSGYQAGQFGTVFGKQQGNQLVTWRDSDDTLLYRAYPLDREGGIAALRTEYLTALWGTRMLALGMFFAGLMMAVAPLRKVLGYIPILGNVGNMVIAAAAFGIAFVVWAVTLLIAILLHNIIALIVVLLLVGGVGYYFWSKRDKEKSPDDLGMA